MKTTRLIKYSDTTHFHTNPDLWTVLPMLISQTVLLDFHRVKMIFSFGSCAGIFKHSMGAINRVEI
jgi:hypothetical protein